MTGTPDVGRAGHHGRSVDRAPLSRARLGDGVGGTPLSAALRSAVDQLARAGIESSRPDARALAAYALGLSPGELARVAELTDADHRRFTELVDRRAARVPLQHLLGRVGFRHLELAIGPGAFVPRPETEVVVQWAVDVLRRPDAPACPLVVDLCTGPGTIALALANEVPTARVHAVERDPGALQWARRNADERAAAGDPHVTLHLGDIADALSELDGTVDLVASNPPYVAQGERGLVEPEVKDHDPPMALWAGADGLDVIRLVEAAARRLLRPEGLVVVEHSDRQGRSAPEVFTATASWGAVADHRDLTGRDRFLTATRR